MSAPQGWPSNVTFITTPKLCRTFPPALIPLITSPPSTRYAPNPSPHPACVMIKRITSPGHPANGQNGLFAKRKIPAGELIIPYLGEIHASFLLDETHPLHVQEHEHEQSEASADGSTGKPSSPLRQPPANEQRHEESDYDLSLCRLSSADPRNPFPGYHISIGVDAAKMGNAARMVNDYRGIPGATAPNAEFRQGVGQGGEMRMEIWSLKCGIDKGEELRVSYGKGWWSARNGN